MTTLQTERDRGARATALLNDDLLVEALTTLREFYIKQWETATDPEKRDRAWLALNNLNMFKGHLTEILKSGKMAAISLDDERKKREAQKHG